MGSRAITSRLHQVGSSAVVFECLDAEVVAAFEELFAGFATAQVDRPDVRVQISASVNEDGSTLYNALLDGVPKCSRVDWHNLALHVTRLLNRHVLDSEPERLHVHAGAVHRDDATVLVLGSSFSGKSTLVAALVDRGWDYLSDEQVGVSAGGELVPYPRPITLRSGSWQFFNPDWFPQSEPLPDRIELPPTRLGQVYHGPAVSPTLVICPDASESSFGCEQLTTAETVARLLKDTLDLERAGEAGIDAMLAIAHHGPSYLISGHDLERTCAQIDELAGSARAQRAPLAQARVADTDSSGRTIGSLAWHFADDSAALYDPFGGAFVQLDGAGYQAWQMLAEDPAHWPAGMAESEFVRQLRDSQLLSS